MTKRHTLGTTLLPALFIGLAVLLVSYGSYRTYAEDTETIKQVPFQVSIDPRVELMIIIFRLAGTREYNQGRVVLYVQDVEKHFRPFKDHRVVKLASELRKTRGVSYDMVMSMAVHLTDAYTLEEMVPFDPHPEHLDGRWPLDEARVFLEEARRFVKDTDFKQFIESHQPLYDEAATRMTKR